MLQRLRHVSFVALSQLCEHVRLFQKGKWISVGRNRAVKILGQIKEVGLRKTVAIIVEQFAEFLQAGD